jgi:hypothetical protein
MSQKLKEVQIRQMKSIGDGQYFGKVRWSK